MPADASSGLFTASSSSTCPSGKFSMTTLSGLRTAIRRSATLFRSSRSESSSHDISIVLFVLVMPIRLQKFRMERGEYPRRRNPLIVGMRGSFQPLTYSFWTSCSNLRLLITVNERFNRANSICRDRKIPSSSRNQS